MDEDDQPYCIDIDMQADLPGVTEERVRDLVIDVLRAEECDSAELSVAVVDGPTIQQLNERYLKHQGQTDVLSFDLGDEDSPDGAAEDEPTVSGQVVVNADQAVRQARLRSVEPSAELMLYIVHGCLHLLDYDDQDAEQARRMHQREDVLLEQFGFGRVYARPERPPDENPGR